LFEVEYVESQSWGNQMDCLAISGNYYSVVRCVAVRCVANAPYKSIIIWAEDSLLLVICCWLFVEKEYIVGWVEATKPNSQ